MEKRLLHRRFFKKSWLLVFLFGMLMVPLNAKIIGFPLQPLSDVLDQISEKYQVIITYNSRLLSKIDIQFEFRDGEPLESAVNRSLDKTGLRYKQLTDKYYIVFKEDQTSQRSIRKIARKFEQIQKLEESESLSVQKITKDANTNLSNVIYQAEQQVALQTSSVKVRAESGSISGTVVDKISGERIPFAGVRLEGTSLGASTNDEGEFMIRQIPAGDYQLIITYIGYVEQKIPVTVIGGKTQEVKVELDYAGVQGEEVIISAQASGQLSAINEQLSSNTIKNVVSSDRIIRCSGCKCCRISRKATRNIPNQKWGRGTEGCRPWYIATV